jgi:hypothetical protein
MAIEAGVASKRDQSALGRLNARSSRWTTTRVYGASQHICEGCDEAAGPAGSRALPAAAGTGGFDCQTLLIGYPGRVSLKSKSIEIGGWQGCPIAAALDVVGDRWSLLVLRDIETGRGISQLGGHRRADRDAPRF